MPGPAEPRAQSKGPRPGPTTAGAHKSARRQQQQQHAHRATGNAQKARAPAQHQAPQTSASHPAGCLPGLSVSPPCRSWRAAGAVAHRQGFGVAPRPLATPVTLPPPAPPAQPTHAAQGGESTNTLRADRPPCNGQRDIMWPAPRTTRVEAACRRNAQGAAQRLATAKPRHQSRRPGLYHTRSRRRPPTVPSAAAKNPAAHRQWTLCTPRNTRRPAACAQGTPNSPADQLPQRRAAMICGCACAPAL